MAVFAILIVNVIGFSLSYRSYREAKMLRRYGSASSAVRDTLSYLTHERRLAAKGPLAALVTALLTLAMHLLAHWPQAAVLAPYRTTLGFLSLLLITLVPVLMLRNRGHFINAFFIRRYLKQQLDHLGHRAGSRREKKR